MTNMPGMFALGAWESRERPRERHRWHLINAPAPLFVQRPSPGSRSPCPAGRMPPARVPAVPRGRATAAAMGDLPSGSTATLGTGQPRALPHVLLRR